MPGALDGPGELALVLRAGACLPARPDLAIFRNKAPQHLGVFVINRGIAISAKLAGARAGIETPRASGLGFIIGGLVAHNLILL